VQNIWLLLKIRCLSACRLLRDNLFDVLILGPLILYGVYLAVGPYIERLANDASRRAAEGWTLRQIVFLLLAAKLILSWRRILEDIHPQTGPESCLLSLPIRKGERYGVLLLERWLKNLAVLALGAFFIVESGVTSEVFALAGLAALVTGAEIGAAAARMELLPRVFGSLALQQRSSRGRTLGWVRGLPMGLAKALRFRLPEDVGALVERDLLLTFRLFSFGVTLHFAAALLCLATLAHILPEVKEDRRVVAVVTGLATAYGVASLALLSPRLLRFQFPFWWIERSASVTPEAIWRAKVWHANLISVGFALLVVASRVWLLPVSLTEAFLVGIEQLLIAILVASFVGALVFETHQQPWLGVLLSGLAATAFALMMIVIHWLLFFAIFPHLMRAFENRAEGRIRFLLLTHDPN